MGLFNYLNFVNLPVFTFWEAVKAVVEIAIISFVIYHSVIFIQRSRAVAILRGMGLLILFGAASYVLQLNTIFFMLKALGAVMLIIIPIVFQPELRRALEQMGQKGIWSRTFAGLEKEQIIRLIHSLVVTLEALSIVRMGALIVLEQESRLDEYAKKSGTDMDSKLTPELLKTIFFPHTFLHDGAVIIRGDRILCAGCFLPLSDNPHLPQEVGSRHRAALGISEVTDAVALTVSEETGRISLAHNGKLIQDIKPDALRELLFSICFQEGSSFSSPIRRKS